MAGFFGVNHGDGQSRGYFATPGARRRRGLSQARPRVSATLGVRSLLQTGRAELYHKVMAQQYDSQHRFYFANYDTAHYGIILWPGQPIERLYVHYRNDEVRVLEIAILPEYRGRGVGRIVVMGDMSRAGDAAQAGTPLRNMTSAARSGSIRNSGFARSASRARTARWSGVNRRRKGRGGDRRELTRKTTWMM